jgi:hypothetical protein
MPVTQQQRIFDAEEAKRFAGLWAGFDVVGNASEAEAMGKGRAVRRMLAGKTFDDGTSLRLVDAFELPEIRQALDDQMEPVRMPAPDVAALQAENEDLRGKLANVVPEVTRLADALTREMELTSQLNARLQGAERSRSSVGPGLSFVLAVALAVECVLVVIGFIGGAAHRSDPASVTTPPLTALESPQPIKPVEKTKPAARRVARPHARPKTKQPVPESSF